MAGTVAILTSNFWPEPTGTGRTTGEFAHYMAAEGFRVRVATALPYYPEWEIYPEYRGDLWSEEEHGRIRILRSWHLVRRPASTLVRIAHETTLSALALPNMVRVLREADVAFVVSPALSYALTASLMAKVAGVRTVLVVKDVMPDVAVEMGMLTNPLLIGLSRAAAMAVYRLADEIHTLGEGMRRRIARLTPDPMKIRIVPDTVDPEQLAPVSRERNVFREEFIPEGVFAVLHAGNMGRKQDLGLILRTADLLRDREEIRFYVIGEGAEKEQFLRRRDELGLGNVEHHPLQPRWLVPHMFSGADVVLVSQLAEVVDVVVPSKLIAAMAAGAMIVAACAEDSTTAELVRESDGGLWIPPGDGAAFASVLEQMLAGDFDGEAYRERSRRFAVERFGRASVYGPVAEDVRSGRIGTPPAQG